MGSTTSGRRKAPRQSPSLAVVAVVAVVALVVLVVVLGPRQKKVDSPPPPQPPTAAAPTPSRPATDVTPPSPFMDDDADLEDEEEIATPAPPPTPAPQACVRFSWRAGLKPGVQEPVPIEVTLTNSCSFEVDCSSIMFEAKGIRGESSVQTVTGAYQGKLNPGESALFTVTLPAEPEGYDRLQIAIVS